MYIGTNVLVYERWLVLKVWYTAGRPPVRPKRFRHSILTLLMHVRQKADTIVQSTFLLQDKKSTSLSKISVTDSQFPFSHMPSHMHQKK